MFFFQAAQDLKELRNKYAEDARGEYKNKIEKYYKELMKKGEIVQSIEITRTLLFTTGFMRGVQKRLMRK